MNDEVQWTVNLLQKHARIYMCTCTHWWC